MDNPHEGPDRTTEDAGDVRAPSGRKPHVHTNSLLVLCFMSMIRGADVQLLPSSFRAMEADLGLKPAYLGFLSFVQGVACSCSGPFWGNLVDAGWSRIFLLTLGSFIWSVCTISLGIVEQYSSMAILRACNGVALACLHPISQSFAAEMADSNNRGSVFSWLYLFSHVGQVIACLFATPLSNVLILGTQGWRFSLIVVGVVSLLFVPIIPKVMVEEPRVWHPDRSGFAVELKKLRGFLRIKTYVVILAQGVFGTIPGAALSFVTMYLQYTGVSDSVAAMINALWILGHGVGGLFGGIFGDMLHKSSPAYGRPLLGQISVLGCIPCVVVMFYYLGPTVSNAGMLAAVLFVHGLIASWIVPGCLCPVMCDIVSRRNLASAYCWEMAIVFASGNAIGPMTVGYLSQHYGYVVNDVQVGSKNAAALASSMLRACIAPYVICATLFTMMYYTYQSDTKDASAGDASECSDGGQAEEPDEATALTGLLQRRTGPPLAMY